MCDRSRRWIHPGGFRRLRPLFPNRGLRSHSMNELILSGRKIATKSLLSQQPQSTRAPAAAVKRDAAKVKPSTVKQGAAPTSFKASSNAILTVSGF